MNEWALPKFYHLSINYQCIQQDITIEISHIVSIPPLQISVPVIGGYPKLGYPPKLGVGHYLKKGQYQHH